MDGRADGIMVDVASAAVRSTPAVFGTLLGGRRRSVSWPVGGIVNEFQRRLMEVCQAMITQTPSSPPPAGPDEN